MDNKPFAFVDIDGTLVHGALIGWMVPRIVDLLDGPTMSWVLKELASYLTSGERGDMEAIRGTILEKAQELGLTMAEVDRRLQGLDEVFESVLFPKALTSLTELSETHDVVLLSSGPQLLVDRFATFLRDRHHVRLAGAVGAPNPVDGNGHFIAPDKGSIFPSKDGKRLAAEAFITAAGRVPRSERAQAVAWGNSHNDEQLLRWAAHPVAINPDRGLRKIANDMHWEVREFDDPPQLPSLAGQIFRALPTPDIAVRGAPATEAAYLLALVALVGLGIGQVTKHMPRFGGHSGPGG